METRKESKIMPDKNLNCFAIGGIGGIATSTCIFIGLLCLNFSAMKNLRHCWEVTVGVKFVVVPRGQGIELEDPWDCQLCLKVHRLSDGKNSSEELSALTFPSIWRTIKSILWK
jgi:hypothetical protein